MTPLYTIGYEKASFDAVLSALRSAGVARVIDVRALPISRRAGFSKRVLATALAEAGIGYTHLRELGTPPEGREANRRRRWPEFWGIVEASLTTPEAAAALKAASRQASDSPSCLLCYEADACTCHRLRVGEMMASEQAFELRHLCAGPFDRVAVG